MNGGKYNMTQHEWSGLIRLHDLEEDVVIIQAKIGGAIWDEGGEGVEACITWDTGYPQLEKRVMAWEIEYEKLYFNERDRKILDWGTFDAEGLAIAKEVKRILPLGFKVFFVSSSGYRVKV